MSVNRVEGSRPLEAAQIAATEQARTTKERVKSEEQAPRRASLPSEDDPKSEPAAKFKPYSLSFRFEKELNRVVVKVIDPETGEAIREIPPESLIEALKQLKKAPGTLVDEEV